MRIGEAAAIAIGFLSVCLLWPRSEPLQVSRTPGNAAALQALISKTLPQTVVLGQAESVRAFDAAALAKEGVYLLSGARGASAWWYLVIKNGTQQGTPQTIVILFSDVELTMPDKRVQARRDRVQLDALATAHEPLLDRLAYHDRMEWWEYTLRQHLPLYRSRESVQAKIDQVPASLLGATLDIPAARLNTAQAALFSPEKWDPAQRASYDQARTVARDAYDLRFFSFESQCASSFLPAMLAQARAQSIRLLFVAIPGRMHVAKDAQKMQTRYQSALEAYLSAQGAGFLDLRTVPRKLWTTTLSQTVQDIQAE